MKKILLTTATAALFLSWSPGESHAGDDKYWWGAGGLLVGGTAGYIAGREHQKWDDRYIRRDYYGNRGYYQTSGPYYSPGQPPLYSPGYYRERRIWPFYRYVEHYPIAGMEPVERRPQAVSVMRLTDNGWTIDQAEPQEVNVNVGDNNSDVQINVGGKRQDTEKQQVEREPVKNENRSTPRGRVVDVPKSERERDEPSDPAVTSGQAEQPRPQQDDTE